MNPLLGLTLRLDYELPTYDPEVHERKRNVRASDIPWRYVR